MGAFQKQKHIKYWLRCLKTLLPAQYTSMDSNRMMLAYFTVSALDILDALQSSTTAEERAGYVDWIYDCQIPEGGFRGFPGTDLKEQRNEENRVWDPANVPATYFALATLAILGDDLKRVDRPACLRWLRMVQRQDGSFGQSIGKDGKIEGGFDPRFAYTASGIRWVLNGGSQKAGNDGVEDVDIEALVKCIAGSQSYAGGLSESAFSEPHGGYTFCAVSALTLLGRLDDGIGDHSALLRWLVLRQNLVEPSDYSEDGIQPDQGAQPPEPSIGFNGRTNKPSDTCYVLWNAGTLQALDKLSLIDTAQATTYLLDHTQHWIGGFGKFGGDPPDIYHSYLGLAALALMGHEKLQKVDAVACISKRARKHIEAIRSDS